MLFRDLPDTVHSTDIAISDELSEEITKEFGLISTEKSENEVLSDSCFMYTQARDVEERGFEGEKPEPYTVDLPF